MLYDKRALYFSVENKLCEMGMDMTFYPLNVDEIAKNNGIEIQYHCFECDSIGAVLYKGENSGILINKNKPLFVQRFDIAHELIHYWFHPIETSFSFDNLTLRDKEKEWQANEGAAELLLPYRDFIPRFIKSAKYVEENYEPLENVYYELSKYYKVSPIVVDYRIRNLENEIMQYYNGTPIESIVLCRTNTRLDKNKKPVVYQSLIKRVNK